MKKILTTLTLLFSLASAHTITLDNFNVLYNSNNNTCTKTDEDLKVALFYNVKNGRSDIVDFITNSTGNLTVLTVEYDGQPYEIRTFSTYGACVLFTDIMNGKTNLNPEDYKY